ncbi:MAG: zinc finger domain-containing protein [Candidatus Heimdallarchaeota archaeon]
MGTVSFGCPVCGILSIVRCSKCRRLGNTYKCPNCGFVGP